jgi:Immune inhibitor A peptidase M6
VLAGTARTERRGASTVVKVGQKPRSFGRPGVANDSRGKVDQYVELAREKTDRIFVVLAEFGNERHPDYPDQDTDPDTPGPAVFDGPLHNKIPEPDRTVDNSTIWQADYSPDHYDTSGGGQNSVNWWTLMAQSRVSAKGDLGIGTRSADLSAWDKLQLGWLDYEVMVAGQRRTLNLGPHEYNSAKPQGVVVVLPKKQVTAEYGAPFAGERMWWSDKGDDLSNTLTPELDLSGASTASATLKARYEIEADFDFLYVQVSTTAARTGPRWTAPSTASRSQGTAAAPRRSPAPPAATGSTWPSRWTASPAPRRYSASCTAPTAAWRRTASSPTRSR